MSSAPLPSPRRRRGAAMLYSVFALVALTAIGSLAVDYGHVQAVKSDMKNCADATARAYIALYSARGQSAADAGGPAVYSGSNNPVDAGSGVNPTVTVTWGRWDAAAKTFTPGGGPGSVAARVTVGRAAASGNPVPLVFGGLIGVKACDVRVSSVAALLGGQTGSFSLSAVGSPYLAGMSGSYVSDYGDTIYNSTPPQVTSVPVIPGTWMSFTSITGTTSILPGYVPYTGPEGDNSHVIHHGENWDGYPYKPGPENGIGDARMPANAFMGVFLTDDPPTTRSPPAYIDWTAAGVQNQPTYSDIELQQPFLVGDGKTSGGTVQKFLVPPGATRLFVGIWDGVQYSNNGGSLSGTISVTQSISLVQ